jgi:hypothetical protein
MRFVLFLLSLPAFAQVFVIQKTTSLSGAAEVITVQQPTSNSKRVEFDRAYVDCSVACTVTLERTGTPATTTTLAPLNINTGETAISVKAFSSSNVGTGTVLSVISLGAGSSVVIDMSLMRFEKGTNTTNLTLRTSAITGTVDITILAREMDQ